MSKLQLLLAGVLALAGCTEVPSAPVVGGTQALDVRPDGRRSGPCGNDERDECQGPRGAASGAATTSTPTTYHGGPVMTGTTNVYLIWYGAWGTNTATTIIPDLVTGLSGSPYFMINTTYPDSSGARPSGLVSLKAQTTVTSASPTTLWKGTSLSDATIQTVVSNAVTAAGWPLDPKAV